MSLESIQNAPQSQRRSALRINHLANIFFLKIAGGRLRAYSLLKHKGRKSGREYRTPITAFPLGDGFVIALLYGDAVDVEWCRNVMAAGGCSLTTKGQEHELVKPEIIAPEQALEAYPPLFKFYYRSRDIQQFVWIHREQ